MSNQKAILESLQRLKLNNDYQYLCTQIKDIIDMYDKFIFDENTSDLARNRFVIKRNTAKLFLELPDDLIQQFTPKE